MVDKRKDMDAATDGTGPASAVPSDLLAAAEDVVTASQSSAARVPKKAQRKIRKLAKELDGARATEAKRLRQAAKAQVEARQARAPGCCCRHRDGQHHRADPRQGEQRRVGGIQGGRHATGQAGVDRDAGPA